MFGRFSGCDDRCVLINYVVEEAVYAVNKYLYNLSIKLWKFEMVFFSLFLELHTLVSSFFLFFFRFFFHFRIS